MSPNAPTSDSHPTWFRSTYSNGAGGECVECASTDTRTSVRDSKAAGEPVMSIPNTAWTTFVQALKQSWLGQSAAKGQRPR
ncbi:DUF397 domain-containing protein [Streptomyces sp. NPDC087425]|uniref:DUF397 domain-containing protein n=1 Tax=Streptomyces sp. NPDC087425 TaxID=3365787 RepID=UPI0038118DD1